GVNGDRTWPAPWVPRCLNRCSDKDGLQRSGPHAPFGSQQKENKNSMICSESGCSQVSVHHEITARAGLRNFQLFIMNSQLFLMAAAAKSDVYDLIKVDYLVNNTAAFAKDCLRKAHE